MKNTRAGSKIIVGYFPGLNPFHLSKCTGQIPYNIARRYNLDCTIVTVGKVNKQEEFYEYSQLFTPGIQILNLKSRRFFKKDLSFAFFLLKNAFKISLLYQYQFGFDFNYRTIFCSLLFKFVNPKGKLFIRFEADYNHLQQFNASNFTGFKRWLIKKYLKSVDYWGTIDSTDFPGLKRIPFLLKHLNKKSYYNQPNGFSPLVINKYVNKVNPYDIRENSIVLSGRLDQSIKGLDVFLRAINGQNLKNWKIWLIGGEKEQVEKIVSYYIDKGTKLNIEILGFVSYSELFSRLNMSKIYVLSSYSDGMPLAAVEGMALGNVIISADHYGMKVALENGKIGKIFPGSDFMGLRKELLYLINNEDETRDLHEQILKKAWKEFTWDSIVKNIIL
jgi:glycosyltransferase involved in cell wall biosynthesis